MQTLEIYVVTPIFRTDIFDKFKISSECKCFNQFAAGISDLSLDCSIFGDTSYILYLDDLNLQCD